MIAELKKAYCLSNSSLACELGLSYTTLMRWKRRKDMGQPAVKKPGPKKVEALNLSQLTAKIRDLDSNLQTGVKPDDHKRAQRE